MQKRSERTRKQIMDSAVALFCEHGYDATSVAEICSAAGASKGAFYHHFPSKQELFLGILNQWLEGVDARLFTQRKAGETVLELFTRMAKALGFVFQAASGQLPMFMEFMVQASRDESVWAATIAPYRRYQQQFAALVAEGQVEGNIRKDINPETTAQTFISLGVGVLLQSVVDPNSANWEKVIKQGVASIIAHIQRSEK
jgi:AcrR family transcriptional regulator